MTKIFLDEGFSFGLALFETLLVKKNIPQYLDEHIERINKSIADLNLNIKKLESSEILSFIQANNENFLSEKTVLKINLSEKNRLFSTRAYSYTDENFSKGFKLKISKNIRNEKSLLVYHKTNNYGESILENRLAKTEGYDEVLFLNSQGLVSECSTSNIFFIKKENEGFKIFSPKISCGLLNGIIRQEIIKKYNVLETEIRLDEVKNFDAAFLTNSVFEIMPIAAIENINFDVDLIKNIKI